MGLSLLLEAVLAAKENERLASEFYADSATKISNPLGKKLFEQLDQFERYHYEKLSALEKNLREKEAFIKYEAHEIPLTPRIMIAAEQDPNNMSVISIIKKAIELETLAEKTYLKLAEETADPDGHYMFSRLSEEEHLHYHILKEAYWSLNNSGQWEWTLR